MAVSSESLRHGDWFRSTPFYEIAVRSFADSNGDGIGDLAGVIGKLDHLADLGVGAIWLLPFYGSSWRDEGYDISNHYIVDPSLGTISTLDRLVREAHARRIRVLGDLVTNHVSIDHPWFQSARRDRNSPYRAWFIWSDTGREFSRTRVIFHDFEPSNWTLDEEAGQYYFHRFYAAQPDLNHDTPAVRVEMLNYARFWLDHGLDGFRCDAVPYLFKREGTKSQSLPEVHAFFQELRTMMDREFPGTVLVAEANQTIPETVPYFGTGREFPMVMHFPLMPNIYLALGEGDARRIRHVLQATLPTPPHCAWAYFLRNHDELTLEETSPDERREMIELYGRDTRSIINSGIRRRLAPMLDGDDSVQEMLTALILALPGAAFLYYGDEIGMGDRLDLPDRDGVRTPMQWTADDNAGFSTAPPARLIRPVVVHPDYAPAARNVSEQRHRPGSLLDRTRRLLEARRSSPEFGTEGYRLVEGLPISIFGFWRAGEQSASLCLYNLGKQPVEGTVPREAEREPASAPLAGEGNVRSSESRIEYALPARRFVWWRFHKPSRILSAG